MEPLDPPLPAVPSPPPQPIEGPPAVIADIQPLTPTPSSEIQPPATETTLPTPPSQQPDHIASSVQPPVVPEIDDEAAYLLLGLVGPGEEASAATSPGPSVEAPTMEATVEPLSVLPPQTEQRTEEVERMDVDPLPVVEKNDEPQEEGSSSQAMEGSSSAAIIPSKDFLPLLLSNPNISIPVPEYKPTIPSSSVVSQPSGPMLIPPLGPDNQRKRKRSTSASPPNEKSSPGLSLGPAIAALPMLSEPPSSVGSTSLAGSLTSSAPRLPAPPPPGAPMYTCAPIEPSDPRYSASQPHVRPTLPHFMGFDNVSYRCICQTTVEPDNGPSTQCEACLAWQHMGCFGFSLNEGDYEGIGYFCDMCKGVVVTRDEGYIESLREMARNPPVSMEVDDQGISQAGPARGGSKKRGNSRAKPRGREASSSSTSHLKDISTPARTSNPPEETSPYNTTSNSAQDMPPPASTARPGRKKTGNPRPKQPRTAVAGPGPGTKEGTPTGMARPSTSPERAVREATATIPATPLSATAAAFPITGLGLTTPVREPVEQHTNSIALRALEYTPIARSLVRGESVRRVLRDFIEEWLGGQEGTPEMDEDGDVDMSEAGPSGKDRLRSTITPSFTLESEYSILGPPIPPVVLHGPGSVFSTHAAKTEVKEEKDELTSSDAIPDSLYPRPTIYGVHTIKTAPEGTFFGEYRGEIVKSETYQQDPINQYPALGMPKPHVHRIGPPLDLVVDARCYGSDLRFIRSGCHPNVIIRPVLHNIPAESEDLEDRVKVTFGIFASSRIAAGKELVMGWEWDDHHVVHHLRNLAANPGPNGDFPMPPIAFRRKAEIICSHLTGTFCSCACTEKVDCAVAQLCRIGSGQPMYRDKDRDSAIAKAKKKKGGLPVPVEKSGKIDLGIMIGAMRNWRTKEEDRARARREGERTGYGRRRLASSMGTEDEQEDEEIDDAGMSEEVEEEEAVETDEEGVSGVQETEDEEMPVVEEEDVEESEVREKTPPPAKAKKSKRERRPEPESPVVEDEPEPVSKSPPKATTSNGSGKSKELRRKPSAVLNGRAAFFGSDSPLSSPDVRGAHSLPPTTEDDGAISDSSTLTEPLTHASDSEGEAPEPQAVVVKEPEVEENAPAPSKVSSKTAPKKNGFRKVRRVMSPSSPIIPEGFVYQQSAPEASAPRRVKLKRKSSPRPSKKAVSEDKAPVRDIFSPPPVPTRRAGVTPELENVPEAGPSRPRGSVSEPQPMEVDVPWTAEIQASPEKEPEPEPEPIPEVVAEPAPPPKKRRIDLKKFTNTGSTSMPHGMTTPVDLSGLGPLMDSLAGTTPIETPGSEAGRNILFDSNFNSQWNPALGLGTGSDVGTPKNGSVTSGNWWETPSNPSTSTRTPSLPIVPTVPITSSQSPIPGLSSTAFSLTLPEHKPIIPPVPTFDANPTPKAPAVELPPAEAPQAPTPPYLNGHLTNGFTDHADPSGSTSKRNSTSSHNSDRDLYEEDTDASAKPHVKEEVDPWSRMPSALGRREVPPHVGLGAPSSDRDGYASTYTTPPSPQPRERVLPTGPRGGWSRDEDPRDRERMPVAPGAYRRDEREDIDYRDRERERERERDRDRDSRDIPRGPRGATIPPSSSSSSMNDYRDRAAPSPAGSPGQARPPPLPGLRGGSPFPARGVWRGGGGDIGGFRGRGGGRGEYRGRGGGGIPRGRGVVGGGYFGGRGGRGG